MTATLEPIASALPASPMQRVRLAQRAWADCRVGERLKVLRRLRHLLAENGETLAAAIPTTNRSVGEKIVSEVLPLAEAILFLERNASRILRMKRWGAKSRPVWLWGTQLTVRREPLGIVLIVAPSNYPLLLLGVQAVQALAAGNAALIKPAPGCSAVVQLLATLAVEAGLRRDLLTVLPESNQAVSDAIGAGADKVVFTGSSGGGRAVLRMAADACIPAVAELSGNDPVFICPDADLSMAARAVAFGMRFNAGQTCVAPGRVFVQNGHAEAFVEQLATACAALQPVMVDSATAVALRRALDETQELGGKIICGNVADDGTVHPIVVVQPAVPTRLLTDGVFGPIVTVVAVANWQAAFELDALCSFHLGATVFGQDRTLVDRLDAGVVIVDDMIAPHADPRLPFGGRGASGFGVTRGAEGLLEMTRPKAVVVRRGKRRPHLAPLTPGQDALFNGYLQLRHGRGFRARLSAAADMIRAGSKSK